MAVKTKTVFNRCRWHRWFAWYPVTLSVKEDHQGDFLVKKAWLVYVDRKWSNFRERWDYLEVENTA